MVEIDKTKDGSDFLLLRFNQRDTSAFTSVYRKFFTEFHLYANCLYSHTSVSAEDAVQDAFCYLWERHDVVFESFSKMKAFLFVVIKNQYKKYLTHVGVEQKYRAATEIDEHFAEDLIESEMGALLLEYIEQLPESGGKIMKLYLSGFSNEDIAEKLQLSIRTVYNIKSRTVILLRRYFSVSRSLDDFLGKKRGSKLILFFYTLFPKLCF